MTKPSTLCLILILLTLSACGDVQADARRRTPSPSPSATATSPPLLVGLPMPTRTPVPVTATPASGCPLPDMLLWQHISASGSYTQTETAAAGPMVCQIERDSCAYNQMIGNHSPQIIFKQEEEPPYNKEDIRMHPAMLGPLTQLSQLVIAEWDGAYWLRVTDAYDSLLEHDLSQSDPDQKYSLHFEGRSIDLTLWPIDHSKYGRLCALAHCAGFDWVQNEGDHCHASVNADSLCLRCGDQ